MIRSTPTSLSFPVRGVPAPQGSKHHVGGGRMVESSKRLPAWRAAVDAAGHNAMTQTGRRKFTTPVTVSATFFIARPACHYYTGKNAHILREGVARTFPTAQNEGDVDKFLRSTYDALKTGGVIRDDCLIVGGTLFKRYAELGEETGAVVAVRALLCWELDAALAEEAA